MNTAGRLTIAEAVDGMGSMFSPCLWQESCHTLCCQWCSLIFVLSSENTYWHDQNTSALMSHSNAQGSSGCHWPGGLARVCWTEIITSSYAAPEAIWRAGPAGKAKTKTEIGHLLGHMSRFLALSAMSMAIINCTWKVLFDAACKKNRRMFFGGKIKVTEQMPENSGLFWIDSVVVLGRYEKQTNKNN